MIEIELCQSRFPKRCATRPYVGDSFDLHMLYSVVPPINVKVSDRSLGVGPGRGIGHTMLISLVSICLIAMCPESGKSIGPMIEIVLGQ